MGIAAKHAYRFGFLKSEKWKNFRLKAMRKYGGRCCACKVESFALDVHHMWYPKDLNKTLICDIRVLCRDCHEKAHKATEPKRYKGLLSAREAFTKFVATIPGNKHYDAKEKRKERFLARQAERAAWKIKNQCEMPKSPPKSEAIKVKNEPGSMNIGIWKNPHQKQKVMRLLSMIFHGDNPPICEERRVFLKKWLDWNHLTAL